MQFSRNFHTALDGQAASTTDQEWFRKLESEVGQARQQLADKEEQLARLKDVLERNTQPVSAAEQPAEDARPKLHQADAASTTHEEWVRRLEEEAGQVRQRLSQKEEQLAQLTHEVERYAEAAEQAETALQELRDRLAQTESALAQRRHEAEQTAAELTAARQELQRVTAAWAEADNIISGLKEHISLLMDDIKEWHAGYTSLQQAHDSSRKKKEEEFAATARHARQVLDALDTARRKVAAELEVSKAEAKDLRVQLTQQSADMDEKDAALHHARSQADRMRELATGEVARAVTGLLNGHRSSSPWKAFTIRRQLSLLRRSGVVDGEWYLSHYTDVAAAGLDPLRHYVEYGAKEGRAPNPALAGANGAAHLNGTEQAPEDLGKRHERADEAGS